MCQTWTVDQTAPAIGNYSVAITDSTVTVIWEGASESDLSGYSLYCNDSVIAVCVPGKQSYSHTHSLKNCKTGDYAYKLTANDKVGNTAIETKTVHFENEGDVGGGDETNPIRVVAAFSCVR